MSHPPNENTDNQKIVVGDTGLAYLTPIGRLLWRISAVKRLSSQHWRIYYGLPAACLIIAACGLGSWMLFSHPSNLHASKSSVTAQSTGQTAKSGPGTLTSPSVTSKTSSSNNTKPPASNTPSGSGPAPAPTQPSGSSSLQPPAIPAHGAYLGSWLNTSGATGSSQTSNELQELPAFNQSIGRQLSIVNFYPSFTSPVPTSTLQTISQNGAMPLISWNCGALSSVNSGADDSLITSFANGLKSYGKPVFMRWYWEMNLNASFNTNCGGYNNGSAYISAWKIIWNIFHQVGATNVAFVWNPSSGGADASQYYPGDAYVDWIGADGYDRTNTGTAAFATKFSNFYNEWSGHGKPILIGETGAQASDQAAYIQGIQQDLPTQFSDIKGVVYWDAGGTSGNWILQGSGLDAFAAMGHAAYFSY